MIKWITRLGYVLAISGGLLLSPAEDLLPVEVWAWMHRGFETHAYYKVVPGESGKAVELSVFGAGVVLILLGKIIRRRGTNDA